MQFKLRLIPAAAVTFLMVACGGGGGGSPAVSTVTSGVATDGHLNAATVLCDVDGTGVVGGKNYTTTTTTDGTGRFSFAQGCSAALVVTGGTNADTNLPFNGVLKAPADAGSAFRVVSPLTSLLAAGMTEAQIKTSLNLSETNLLHTDPAATSSSADILTKTLALQQLIQKTAELLVGLTPGSNLQTVYSQVAFAFASLSSTNSALLGTPTAANIQAIEAAVMASVSIANKAVGTALTTAGGVPNLAAAVGPALNAQVQLLLAATPTTIASVTTTVQQNTAITTTIIGAIAIAPLTPTSATDLSNSLAVDAVATVPPPVTTNYLSLAGDAISYDDGTGFSTAVTSYTMASFNTGAGITMKWPVADTAAIKFTLSENGTAVLVPGQTLTAGVSIVDTSGGLGQISAYVDNVSVTRTSAGGIQIQVPTTGATSLAYGVSGDGTIKAVKDFSSYVSGVSNTLTATANSIGIGGVVNYAVSGLGTNFSSMATLNGKYKVTIVVKNLPLQHADGTPFAPMTLLVPTGTSVKSITGVGLEGFITLTN